MQVVARSDAMEQPLVLRRHELAVLVHETARAEQEQRVVERSRASGLALVDAHHGVDPPLPADRDELVDERSRHVDGVEPHALP
jgi:hypothetical protein